MLYHKLQVHWQREQSVNIIKNKKKSVLADQKGTVGN